MRDFIKMFLHFLFAVLMVSLTILGVICVVSQFLGAGTIERLLQKINASWTYEDLLKVAYIYGAINFAALFAISYLRKSLSD